MSAAETTLLAYIEETIRGLLPFLARFSLRASDKALSIKSASETIAIDANERIEVGEHSKAVVVANGSLPAARKTDGTGNRYLQVVVSGPNVTAVVEWWSPDGGTTWSATATGPLPPVPGMTVGTPESISTSVPSAEASST